MSKSQPTLPFKRLRLTTLFEHREKGITMAIASRTPTPHVAEAFMKKLGKAFSDKARAPTTH